MSALTRQQALDCFASDDLIGLGMEADAVRRRLHPEAMVTYALETTLAWPDLAAPAAALEQQIVTAADLGMTGLQFSGNLPAGATLPWVEALFAMLRERFPEFTFTALAAEEIAHLCAASGADASEVLRRLQGAGLDGLSQAAPAGNADALRLHRTAHGLGMQTAATVVFGGSPDVFAGQLFALRDLQAETGGFTAVLPRARSLPNPMEDPTAVETLKTVAIARLALDNIPHIQGDPVTQGLKVVQMSLSFGADDLGNIPLTLAAAHRAGSLTEEELRRLVRDAGFQPAQRDAVFRAWFLP